MFLQGKKVLAQFFKQEEKKTTPPIEVEFSFHFMVNGVKISGRLDRIDEEEGDIIITDYKTGEKKEDSAKYDLRKSTQLPIYAWGYSERYHKFPQKIVLHYLESNFSVEVEGEKLKERVEEVKEKVATVIQGLREGNFNPIPGYECRWCDFRGICEEGEEL
jgi:DNA helicase-2/ATP-dependent DNA helicase PcrA